MMIVVHYVVSRIDTAEGFRTLWLVRDEEALLVEHAWHWTQERWRAQIFKDLISAQTAAAEMGAGIPGVCGRDEVAQRRQCRLAIPGADERVARYQRDLERMHLD